MSSLHGKKLAFIGAGNMARAIAAGVIGKGTVRPADIVASDISELQRAEFEKLTSAQTTGSNPEATRWADVVIFAVKPFHVATVCDEIRHEMRPDHLVISICAGITTQFLEQKLGGNVRVVRAMPNTPALIGCGATAVAAGSRATREDLECVLELFRAVGVAIELPESALDIVTGLSGSGPAYVFYFAEALIAAAEKLGLAHDAAEILVKQTLHGASRLALESQQSLESLRAAVTTKGGTTEAGLRTLEQEGFQRAIFECVAAAARRSVELSQR